MKIYTLLAVLVFSCISHALPESSLPASFQEKALPYFQSVPAALLATSDGQALRYLYFPGTVSATKGTIVIIDGRTEFAEQYAELLYDWADSGYDIFIYDHRGQGKSSRLVADPFKGYVTNFQDYVNDLDLFMNEIVLMREAKGRNIYFLSHSMGGAISTEYLIQHPGTVKAMVASSPMYAPNLTGKFPDNVADILKATPAKASLQGVWTAITNRFVTGLDGLTQQGALDILNVLVDTGLGEDYAPGKSASDWDAGFLNNTVDNSANRYDYSRWMMEQAQDAGEILAVGGPTNRWVREAIQAGLNIKDSAAEITTPILILQASQEQVVVPEAQNKIQSLSPAVQLKVMQGAKHDILLEKDTVRDLAKATVLEFFKAH